MAVAKFIVQLCNTAKLKRKQEKFHQYLQQYFTVAKIFCLMIMLVLWILAPPPKKIESKGQVGI